MTTWNKIKLVRNLIERKREVRVCEPETQAVPKPKQELAIPGETYLEMLQRRTREDVAAGRAISMNDMLRSIPPRRPPRKPSWDR